MPTLKGHPDTRIDEVAASVYRITTAIPPSAVPGGFTFNRYLVVDDEPLLFHTGPRRMFPIIHDAIASVMPIEKLRWIGVSHVEADECGALNGLLAVAPQATALCSQIAAMVSLDDLADRPPRGLANGEIVSLGRRKVTWLDAPHVPHAWECGYLFEQTDRTLFCGDLFTQSGSDPVPLTTADILGPSEEMRALLDYYSHTTNVAPIIEQLAATRPATLACMHGSAWAGDGEVLLRALGKCLATGRAS
jgi:flavorubredoxin